MNFPPSARTVIDDNSGSSYFPDIVDVGRDRAYIRFNEGVQAITRYHRGLEIIFNDGGSHSIASMYKKRKDIVLPMCQLFDLKISILFFTLVLLSPSVAR